MSPRTCRWALIAALILFAGILPLFPGGPWLIPGTVPRAFGAAEPAGKSLFDASRRVQGVLQGTDAGAPLWSQGPVNWSLEEQIDPETYRLVPGDQLHVGLWGETPRSYVLAVTPQGELILPDLGPVPVAGEPLRKAEEHLARLLGPLYPRAKVSLRLISPGKFRIPVTGMVDHPGIFEATRVDRLSALLVQAGGVRNGGSLRRIRLQKEGRSSVSSLRSDAGGSGSGGAMIAAADPAGAGAEGGGSTIMEVDLLPWLVSGDAGSNPLIEPGWSVEVPPLGPTMRVRGPVNGRSGVEVAGSGSVRLPDRPEEEPNRIVEWREGDTVGSVLDLLGGLSERASGEGILFSADGSPAPVDLRSDAGRSIPLHPGEALEVGYASRWVFVVGAVRSPGRYPYLPGLTAPEYINMAGGPSELGRKSWKLEGEGETNISKKTPLRPGLTVRVPERRSYTLTTILTPLTTAAALLLSVVALARS